MGFFLLFIAQIYESIPRFSLQFLAVIFVVFLVHIFLFLLVLICSFFIVIIQGTRILCTVITTHRQLKNK